MKKLLYAIELSYSVNVTKEQRERLNKYTDVSFKTEKDFEMSSYDEGYKETTDIEKEEYKKKRYKKYMEKGCREVDIKNRVFPVCIEDFVKDCYFVEFKVIRPIEVDVEMRLVEIEETIERFERAVEKIPENTFNSLTNVHIGGSLLMNINELKLYEDACTDDIQTGLDSGWRVVACCVQPDGRRPDYILGRYNADRVIASPSERG